MSIRKLDVGTRVRLKFRSLLGWKGTGTVIASDGAGGVFIDKDDGGTCNAALCQVAILRNQNKPGQTGGIEKVA